MSYFQTILLYWTMPPLTYLIVCEMVHINAPYIWGRGTSSKTNICLLFRDKYTRKWREMLDTLFGLSMFDCLHSYGSCCKLKVCGSGRHIFRWSDWTVSPITTFDWLFNDARPNVVFLTLEDVWLFPRLLFLL